MATAARLLGAVVTANNRRVERHAADRFAPNPRDLTGSRWNDQLEAAWPVLRDEWHAFRASGGRLPRIADLIDEDQGNEGVWRAGLLVSKGRPVPALAHHFPRTQAALEGVPGIWSALWSVLEPDAALPEHVGPNGGVLRYHLGIECGDRSALQVGDRITPYRDGKGILFDDTAPHAAWNHGDHERVTLFLEVLRPTSGAARSLNLLVQHVLALDPRYRRAPARAAEWAAALAPAP